jgi:hypothetical protein
VEQLRKPVASAVTAVSVAVLACLTAASARGIGDRYDSMIIASGAVG